MIHTKLRYKEICLFLLTLVLAVSFAWSAQDYAAPTTQIPPTTQMPSATQMSTAAPQSVPTQAPTSTHVPTSSAPPSTTESTQAAPLSQFDPNAPYLRLVNVDNPLPKDYAPELVQIGESDRYVSALAYDALCQMLADGRQEGLRFHIASAYRSTELQIQLFDEDVRRRMANGMSYEEAYADTALFTMPPGCSEHESGLALDIVAVANQNLDDSQQYTPETQWLNAHCHEYGFILRYPQDKTEITGIAHESWHYRYVGRDAAIYIREHDLTLEEFLSIFEETP